MTQDRTGCDQRYGIGDREAGPWGIGATVARIPIASHAAGGGGTARSLWLARALDREILPRLLKRQAIRSERFRLPAIGADLPIDALPELVTVLRSGDDDWVSSIVDRHLSAGVAIETVLLGLLTPAARHFGDLWAEDLVGFAEVTLVVYALQHQLRRIVPAMVGEHGFAGGDLGAALLLPTPGEQHSFGLLMVAEFLRKAGWAVWTEFPASSGEVGDIVAADWFSLVGLSIGGVALRDVLARSVSEIRRRSANPDVAVLLGGPAVLLYPALADEVGADGAARDAVEAVVLAGRVGARHERRTI
jgi:methanogenic corrinoid protein MtbC1